MVKNMTAILLLLALFFTGCAPSLQTAEMNGGETKISDSPAALDRSKESAAIQANGLTAGSSTDATAITVAATEHLAQAKTGALSAPKLEDLQYPFPAKGVPILMYHSISLIPGNNLGVPPEQFAQQMKYLFDSGYSTISLEQLYQALQGQAKLPAKPVVLTFDDGYADNYSAAFPILKQYNFKATIFMITSAVGPGMLTWDQLKEMRDYGISIQSHTVNHPDLRSLSEARQQKELADSKAVLEQKLGPVEFFCYPSGKYNNTTLALLKQLGYKLAVTTEYGFVKPGENPLLLKRVRINGNSSLATFKQQVSF